MSAAGDHTKDKMAKEIPFRHKSSTPSESTPRFGIMWYVMRLIGGISLPTFYGSVTVQGQHHVPPSNTPLIVCATHTNTILDVAMLASHTPERRHLHFWAKSGLFHNPIVRFILTSSGNIKVDHRNKNNQALFQGTFQALKNGGVIALFPEGGSYTIPSVAKLKAGAAWAALEYARHLQMEAAAAADPMCKDSKTNQQASQIKVLPAAIVYTDKSKMQSRALLEFGQAISLDKYIDEFLSSTVFPSSADSLATSLKTGKTSLPHSAASIPSGASLGSDQQTPAQRALARLTDDIYTSLLKITSNAPNWQSFHAVRAARELIFGLQPHGFDIDHFDMRHFVPVSNALLHLLSLDSNDSSQVLSSASKQARHRLFVFSCLLHLCDTDSFTLSRILRRYHSIQPSVTESEIKSLPSSNITLSGLWTVCKSFLVRLPYLIPIYLPTLIPTYLVPNYLAHHFAGREEESLSTVKALFSFGSSLILYSFVLIKIMAISQWAPPGFLVGVLVVWWMIELNRACLDTAYGLCKQLRLAFSLFMASNTSSVKRPNPSTGSSSSVESIKVKPAAETTNLFFYGTLVHPKILARVIGNPGSHLTVRNGILTEYLLCHVRGHEYPGLISQADIDKGFSPTEATRIIDSGQVVVKGTLVSGLTSKDLKCLDVFEGQDYVRKDVEILLDPEAKAESNAIRIDRDGAMETILDSLTPERIHQIKENSHKSRQTDVIKAQVYAWKAPFSNLESRIWQFDQFAKQNAKRWVGDRGTNFDSTFASSGQTTHSDLDRVENESEYEMVDRVRDLDENAQDMKQTKDHPDPSLDLEELSNREYESNHQRNPSEDREKGLQDVVDIITLNPSMRASISRVVQHLGENPSIQYYVNQAFRPDQGTSVVKENSTTTKRPSLSDPYLLDALLRSRYEAWISLEKLIQLVSTNTLSVNQTPTTNDALQTLRDEIDLVKSSSSDRWPFVCL